jgi:REP element-mobilizing transposase RayT
MPYIRIWVHLIWSTKNRERLITPKLKPLLVKHIIDNAKTKKIYLSQINCVADHCHALISLGASQSISKAAFLIKGESSHWVNENNLVSGHFEWQDEYIAVSVSESQIENVKAYIKNQEEHHRSKTFSEEYDLFLKRYGFKYLG